MGQTATQVSRRKPSNSREPQSNSNQRRARRMKELEVLNADLKAFFEKPMRNMIENIEFDDWSIEMKRKFLYNFGVKNSVVKDRFLRKLKLRMLNQFDGEFKSRVSGECVKKLEGQHIEELTAAYSNFLKFEEKEEDRFKLCLQFLHTNLVKLGLTKIDFGLLVLVLKIQIFLTIYKPVLNDTYNMYLERDVMTNEEFLIRYCRLKITEEDIMNNGNLQIVYIITDTAGATTKWQKLQKKFLVNTRIFPLLDRFWGEQQFEYGMFHPCVKLGPVYLEWDNGSLITCQNYNESWSSSFARAAFRVCDIKLDSQESGELVRKLNGIITRWNKYVIYSQRNKEGEGFGNCHKFFTEIRNCLKECIKNFKEENVISGIIDRLKNQTDLTLENIYKFGLTSELKGTLGEYSELAEVFQKIKVCESHEEYDRLCTHFYGLFLEITEKSFDEVLHKDYTVFKAFDRGFWMRYNKYKRNYDSFKDINEKEDYTKWLLLKGIDLNYHLQCKDLCPFKNAEESTLNCRRFRTGVPAFTCTNTEESMLSPPWKRGEEGGGGRRSNRHIVTRGGEDNSEIEEDNLTLLDMEGEEATSTNNGESPPLKLKLMRESENVQVETNEDEGGGGREKGKFEKNNSENEDLSSCTSEELAQKREENRMTIKKYEERMKELKEKFEAEQRLQLKLKGILSGNDFVEHESEEKS